jgi:dTDP-4-dehydrorhamnose reductase
MSLPARAPLPAERFPVAILGTTGQLGWAMGRLFERGASDGHGPVRAFSRAEVDLARPETIELALAGRGFRTIITCAAWTDVDGAEKDEGGANAVNGEAIGHLAGLALREGALLVNFSTDYVFDGRGTSPYAIDHAISPVNAYGRSKALGERLLRESGCEHLLIRTSWVYAPMGKNFVRTIAAAAATRPSLRVVNDQRGRPTSAENLAAVALELMAKGGRGTVHATDGGECTWFELAREVVRLAGHRTPVEPCTTADFPRPAARPAYSVLDLRATEELVGPMMPWQEALAHVMAKRQP